MTYRLFFALVFCTAMQLFSLESNTLRSTCEAKAHAIADQAKVVVVIEKSGPNPNVAEQSVAKEQHRLLQALKQEPSITQLQSKKLSVYPIHDPQNYNRITEYRAQVHISWHSLITEVSKTIRLSLQQGATEVQTTTAYATEKALQEAREEALKKSIAKALQEGKAALSALSLHYQGIDSIEISPKGIQPIAFAMAMNKEMDEATPVEPITLTEQTTEVRAQVVLTLRFTE